MSLKNFGINIKKPKILNNIVVKDSSWPTLRLSDGTSQIGFLYNVVNSERLRTARELISIATRVVEIIAPTVMLTVP